MLDDLKNIFDLPFLQGKDKDEITVKIEGEEIKVISAKILRTFDNPSDSFSAVVYWDPTDANSAKLLRLFGYQQLQVFLGGNLVLTGRLTSIKNTVSAEGARKEIVGHSHTVDFVDSDIIPPWEVKNTSLIERAKFFAKAVFDSRISVDYKAYTDGKKPFKKVKASKSQTIFSHLSDLANQRSIVIGNGADGTLLLTKVNDVDLPVATLKDNKYPAYEYSIECDTRKRFAHYVVFAKTPGRKQAIKKKFKTATATDESVPTIINTYKMFDAHKTDLTNLQAVADWHRSKQFASAFALTYPVSTWYADNDKLWEPNTLVTVESNFLELANGFDFLIRAVEYNLDENGTHAVLSLVPPQAFTGKAIKDPWNVESDDSFLTTLKEKTIG